MSWIILLLYYLFFCWFCNTLQQLSQVSSHRKGNFLFKLSNYHQLFLSNNNSSHNHRLNHNNHKDYPLVVQHNNNHKHKFIWSLQLIYLPQIDNLIYNNHAKTVHVNLFAATQLEIHRATITLQCVHHNSDSFNRIKHAGNFEFKTQ